MHRGGGRFRISSCRGLGGDGRGRGRGRACIRKNEVVVEGLDNRESSNSERTEERVSFQYVHEDGQRERPPSHLKGKEIGLWYARRDLLKKRSREIENAAEIKIDTDLAARLDSLISEFSRTMVSNPLCSFTDILNQINHPIPRPRTFISPIIKRNEQLDKMLLDKMKSLESKPHFQAMLKFRQKLPAFECKDAILKSIAENQVVVISGETGCGKTTQVPAYLLDDMISSGNGSLCNVLCTQPRRISAISVAERVADERCERIGSNSVGYVIRLESKKPSREQGTITFCTTGVVFQYLKDDPFLLKYTHLVLDEVHERDSNSDILIKILQDLIKVRPDLKIVLMSATINADHFSNYFGKCPMFHIPGLTFPVTEYYLEDIIERLNFEVVEREQTWEPRRRFNRQFSKWGDREYENYLHGYIQRCLRDKYSKFTISQILKPESEGFDCLMQLAANLLESICCIDQNNGAVLIFVTGWGDISKLNSQLTTSGRFPPNKYLILPLHSMMPTINQREIFERPRQGVRKIIISTNLAETSITIDDIVHVIDFGKSKLTNFDKSRNIEELQPVWISRANSKQRRGRAGRVQEGYCYHLFSRARESTFEDFQKPEVLRKRLEEVILQLKRLKLGEVRSTLKGLLDPPSNVAVNLSFERLVLLQALDESEDLTPLGYHLSEIPVHPAIGKMLLMGAVFSVVDPVFSVAASLGFKDPFHIPLGKEKIVDKIRKKFADGSKSDHWAIVKALEGYETSLSRNSERDFCFTNYLSPSTCKLLVDYKRQFAELLYEKKFLQSDDFKAIQNNLNSKNIALVKAIICCGLYPNIAKITGLRKRQPNKPPFPVLQTEDGTVYFHPKSINAEETVFESPLMVYHMKQKLKQIMIFDSTMISPYPLIFFGGKLEHKLATNVDGKRPEIVEIDGKYRFKISKDNFELVKSLRCSLDNLLGQKIGNPSPTAWDSGIEGQLLLAIRDLITSQYHELKSGVAEHVSHDEDDLDDD